jgi:hypothetical protein
MAPLSDHRLWRITAAPAGRPPPPGSMKGERGSAKIIGVATIASPRRPTAESVDGLDDDWSRSDNVGGTVQSCASADGIN